MRAGWRHPHVLCQLDNYVHTMVESIFGRNRPAELRISFQVLCELLNDQ